MPILGIGTDIVEVGRIQAACERDGRFAKRVFTEAELEYAEGKQSKYLHLAGRFAAKEAVAKALGYSLSWKDVEIVANLHGSPRVILRGKAKGVAGSARVHISISHIKEYATAVAVVED